MIDEKGKEKILQANVSNIVRKVKSGKPLSSAEIALVESQEVKKETRSRLPTYDSIVQCSGATGIPVRALKQAKRAGCEAFKSGSRVDLGLFIKWAFTEKGADAGKNWLEEKTKGDAMLRQQKFEKMAGRLMEVAEARRQSKNASLFFFGELDRAQNERPPIWKGLGEIDLFEEFKKWKEQVRKNSIEHFEKVGSLEK